jgi:hypothetical protein
MKAQRMLAPLAAALVTGCQTPGAVFVTKSSLAIADIDGTPAEMTVAMHRVEGFIAPRNQNGNTPPVLAHIQSNRDMWNPEVVQVYATGTAAERIAGDYKSNNSECDSCVDPKQSERADAANEGTTRGNREEADRKDKGGKDPFNAYASPVVFATSTTIGLRIGLTSEGLIDGLVLGYRRKEMSFVPSLAKDKEGTYRYPSLIAAIQVNSKPEEKDAAPAEAKNAAPVETTDGEAVAKAEVVRPGFRACQGFATGTAATKLAESNDRGLGCLSGSGSLKGLLTARNTPELRQQAEIDRVLSCYVELSPERKTGVRANAMKLGLLAPGGGGLVQTSDGIVTKQAFAEDAQYTMHLLGAVVSALPKDEDHGASQAAALLREHQLRAHREAVCTLMKRAAEVKSAVRLQGG